jgi:hypothetical protein
MAGGADLQPGVMPHVYPGLWCHDLLGARHQSSGRQAVIALEAQPEDAADGRPALRWVPAGDVDVAALSSSVRKIHALAGAARVVAGPR